MDKKKEELTVLGEVERGEEGEERNRRREEDHFILTHVQIFQLPHLVDCLHGEISNSGCRPWEGEREGWGGGGGGGGGRVGRGDGEWRGKISEKGRRG